MLASLKGYGLDWPAGAERLLIVSVGTGGKTRADDAAKILRGNPVALAVNALASVMDDAAALNETLLQWLSQSPTARTIDAEVGDLRADVFGGGQPWLSYVRYDVQLDRQWLAQRLKLALTDAQLAGIEKMDAPQHIARLVQIGEAAAKHLPQDSHFPAAFDH